MFQLCGLPLVSQSARRCVYFIDPGEIVPPAVTAPPAPMVSRTKPDLEPVILEPPVTTNPTFTRLTLPQTDISAIRRLSARVNVLPVIARADMLSTDRLAAVKIAVRRDLAAAGIGFGIFDGDAATQFPYAGDASDIVVPRLNVPGEQLHAYTGNGSPQGGHSPSATPLAPSLLRLPFALISPDVYSHSDGVNRPTLQRHELVHQYTPSSHRSNGHDLASKISRGRFLRSYRWGTLDCMDLNHCDFLHLRGAIFYHMRVRTFPLNPIVPAFDHGAAATLRPSSGRPSRSTPANTSSKNSAWTASYLLPLSHKRRARPPSCPGCRSCPKGHGLSLQ